MSQSKPVLSLAAFQASMAHAVMRPLVAGDSMSRENRAVANELVKPNDRLTSSDRLQIYNQQYWWRLLSSFSDDFGGLRSILGERKFHKLSVAYLNSIGSRSWNLRDLGSHLESYLLEHPEWIAPHGQLAIEMVRVEWGRIVAFDGEEKKPLDPEEFVTRRPERMTLALQPYVTLLELHYPIDHLLRRLKHSEAGSASNAVSAERKPRPIRLTSRLAPAPIYLAIHRSELLVYYKRLEPEAFHVLTALRDGNSLEAACEFAFGSSTESPESISEKIRTWFTMWMSFGWLCDRT
jgi:hypothetical protein